MDWIIFLLVSPSDEALVLKRRKRGLSPRGPAEGRIWGELEAIWWKTRGIWRHDNWGRQWVCCKSKWSVLPLEKNFLLCIVVFYLKCPLQSSIIVFPRPLLHSSFLPPCLSQPWPSYCNRPRYRVQVFQWKDFFPALLFCIRSNIEELYEQFQNFSESALLGAAYDPTLRCVNLSISCDLASSQV